MSAAARLAARRRAEPAPEDVEFAEYVRGKTIAVVGPAPADGDQLAAVDAHDLVYRVSGQWDSGDQYGHRADIVFTNGQRSRDFRDGKYRDRFAALGTRWLVTKANVNVNVRGLSIRQGRKPPGVNPLQVTMALYDLAMFDPADVTVFGADFYVAGPGAAYTPEYRAHFPQITINSARSSFERAHRIVEQLATIRTIRQDRGWPSGDRRFLDVVGMDEATFQQVWKLRWYGEQAEKAWEAA